MKDAGEWSLFECTRRGLELPRWRAVRQNFPHRRLPPVAAAVAAQMALPEVAATVCPGMRVTVTVGSRGIGRLPAAVAAVGAALRPPAA